MAASKTKHNLKVSIFHMVDINDFEAIQKEILDCPASINSLEKSTDNTPLLKSIVSGSDVIFEFLLNNGADIHLVNKAGECALSMAVYHGRYEMVCSLLERGADVNYINIKDSSAWPPLLESLRKKKDDVHPKLCATLARHPDLDINFQLPSNGDTALILAADNDFIDIVEILIKRGANANMYNIYGNTATMRAAAKGHIDIAVFLVEHGADLTPVDKTFGKTAMQFLSDRSHQQQLVTAEKRGRSQLTAAQTLRLPQNEILSQLASINEVAKIIVACYVIREWNVEAFEIAMDLLNSRLLESIEEFEIEDHDLLHTLTFEFLTVPQASVDFVIAELPTCSFLRSLDIGNGSLTNDQVVEVMECVADPSTSIKYVRCRGFGLDFDFTDPANPVWFVDSNYLTRCDNYFGMVMLCRVIQRWPCLLSATEGNGKMAAMCGGGESSPVHNTLLKAVVDIIRNSTERKGLDCVDQLSWKNNKITDIHDYAFWFALICHDELSNQVRDLAKRDPRLIHVGDHRGRDVLAQATVGCKQAIMALSLVFERYMLTKPQAVHVSSTCEVYLATDETAGRTRVALKFMNDMPSFHREVGVRKHFGGMNLTEHNLMDMHKIGKNFDVADTRDCSTNILWQEEGYGRVRGLENKHLFPFCVVFPAGDRSLNTLISHEHIAATDWDQIRVIGKSIFNGVECLHKKRYIHGDIKPLNILRVGHRILLIDFDACTAIGQPCGAKYSSCFVPPELVYIDNGVAKIRTPKAVLSSHASTLTMHRASAAAPPGPGPGPGSGTSHRQSSFSKTLPPVAAHHAVEPIACDYDILMGHESFDVWSVGAVLYHLCSGESLFLADAKDNIDSENLMKLHQWTPEFRQSRLNKISDRNARNLVSQLLSKDPKCRPTVQRAMNHPFFTGKQVERLVGEDCTYDVFISYRVASDSEQARILYEELTKRRDLRVFLDTQCLAFGKSWEVGFCDGLAKSIVFVALMSDAGINNPSEKRQNFTHLAAASPVDNVLLEYRLALELKSFGMLSAILPVLYGKPNDDGMFSKHTFANHDKEVVVNSMELKLSEHLERLGFGLPIQPDLSVNKIMKQMLVHQGILVGKEGDEPFPFDTVAKTICQAVTEAKFDIQRSLSSNSSDSGSGSLTSRTLERVNTMGGGGGVRAALAAMDDKLQQLQLENNRLREKLASLGVHNL